ncbi:MAG: Glutathione-regulated potassium-efflux system protein KefC [Myxococcaceae bacterium]|nr:Glutathione-regulated potassium-efflux system protein KefC [Myxococcaceae bacterium]
MHELSLLHDLLVIFAAAIAVSLAGARIGLPSLAGMIVAGALIGPHALGLIGDPGRVSALAEIGVVLLLFGVGIELPFGRLRELFRPMVIGGGLQVVLTGLFAYALSREFGLAPISAVLVSFVAIPSSTAIVLRRLHARGELEAPHGRQMLGILLFQDLCVVPMMIVLPALADAQTLSPRSISLELAKSLGILGLVVLTARVLAPKLLRVVAGMRQRDVFVLSVMVVVLGTAWAATMADVSLALGAFMAGVVISGSEHRHQALGELMPFREVFASLFFVTAGMLLDGGLLLREPAHVLGLFAALLLGKALLVLLLCSVMGLSLRASILSALGLAQVGEFALVLLESVRALPVLAGSLGALEGELLTASILSMIAAPLLASLSPRLAARAELWGWLRRHWIGAPVVPHRALERSDHVIVAGYGVAGRALALELARHGVQPIIVDLNAALLRHASDDGFCAYFGDIATPEVLEQLNVGKARELVLLISDPTALERAVSLIRRVAPHVFLTVRTRYAGEVKALAAAGANEVVAAEVEAGRAITACVLRRCKAAAA